MHGLTRLSPVARLGLLAITALGVLGARFCWVEVSGARWFQAKLGYYFLLTLLTLWGVFFFRVAVARSWLSWKALYEHRLALIVVSVLTVIMHLHEPHVLRILYDEPTHVLGGLVMHLDKTAMLVAQSNYVGDDFTLTGHYASFRQYLFPLLLSLLHDFTGYREANVFVLNFLLTPAVLWFGYLIGWKLEGRMAGLIAAGLLGTLPLLGQNATSGGYDVLNLLCLGATVFFALAYVQAPEGERKPLMDLSLATVLLLAVARSESILYVVPWALVAIMLWRRSRRIELTGFAAVSPLFLLPHLMCNLIMVSSEVTMNVSLRKNGEAFFDINNLPKHVSETIYYLFNFDRGSTNSVILSLLGLLGFVGLMVFVAGMAKRRQLAGTAAVVALFAVWTTLVYLFVLTNFWGSPADVLAARFCLPVMFVWAVVAGWCVVQFTWLRSRPRLVFGVLLFWFVVGAAPVSSRAFATYNVMTSRADRWFVEYAGTRDRKTTLYIEGSNVSLMVHRYASSRLQYLCDFPAVFVRAIKAGLYRDVIVFQTLEGVPETGEWRPRLGNEVPASLVLETIEERVITPLYLARISRLVGYKKADGSLVTPASDDPEINLKRSFASEPAWLRYRLSLYP